MLYDCHHIHVLHTHLQIIFWLTSLLEDVFFQIYLLKLSETFGKIACTRFIRPNYTRNKFHSFPITNLVIVIKRKTQSFQAG